MSHVITVTDSYSNITGMARTKLCNRKSKGMDKTLLDAFTTAFDNLQKQIRTLQRKAPTKEKKILEGSKKLIPKPPGSAGKSTGYNLQDAMGLGKKTHQYNCYLKGVRALSEAILEPKKTWRQQPMALRVQVVGLVPVAPKKSNPPARPTGDDDDDTMNVDAEHPSHKKSVPKGKKKKPATNPSKVPVAPKKSNSGARPTGDDNISNENANEHQHPKWQRMIEKTSDKNQVDVESCLDGPPPVCKSCNCSQAKHVAGSILISRCPQEDCTDIIPDEPHPRLKDLIHYRKELVVWGAHKTRFAQVDLDICQELSNELWMLQVARANGYLEVINFAVLPGRINKMSDLVKSLIWAAASSDLKCLERNFIFCRLIYDLVQTNIGTTPEDALVNFSALRYSAIPDMIREKSRPGYYGAIGYEVIYGVIIDQVEAMSPNMDTFYPLSVERLIQFILIPNVACQLIAEDKHINLQDAYEDLIHSSDVGGALQQVESDEERIEDLNIAFTTAERGVASPVGETHKERINRRPVDDRTILDAMTNINSVTLTVV
ncbi:hypothetical protein JVT61DRAFT_15495 [Boletus reticuloceps]|uniref:Restriction of telomere capping protein 4 C-terminal domain-containing protein n=1 Tax=Boletus reticuloceps TaxID=495285 RepID=A0A8I2YCJ4_9AGAM|nr:hypothetical protein JVT61DRAFT_15495 [Boletus reticuloceps]